MRPLYQRPTFCVTIAAMQGTDTDEYRDSARRGAFRDIPIIDVSPLSGSDADALQAQQWRIHCDFAPSIEHRQRAILISYVLHAGL